ncbi:hypothetical protein BJ165DRAFT_1595541 [Panaeolus papilionaceus]|nr:hypothetical protein BJ165DRAFT_1595541 [Panaeolus papilionaceus]
MRSAYSKFIFIHPVFFTSSFCYSMTETTTLPLEIIEEIFSQVDDKNTISQCSRTSTWFRQKQQQRLFASVEHAFFHVVDETIEGQRVMLWDADIGEHSRASSFLAAIIANPRLATYVHRVELRTGRPDTADWVPKKSSFLGILPYLTRLRQFICRPTGGLMGSFTFSQYSRPVQLAIYNTLERSEDIEHVDLGSFLKIPPSVLYRIPKIGHLSLVSVASMDDEGLPNVPIPVIYPTTLEIQMHGLQTDAHHVAMQRSNRYSFIPNPGAECPPINLSSLHELRTLKIMIPIRCCPIQHGYDPLSRVRSLIVRSGIVSTPLRWLSAVIRSLPDVDPGRESQLCLDLWFPISITSVEHVSFIPWDLLAQALISKRKHLKKILITVVMVPLGPFPSPSTEETVTALKDHTGFQLLRNMAHMRCAFAQPRTQQPARSTAVEL